MNARHQWSVAYIKLGCGLKGAFVHGEGVKESVVVSGPHLSPAERHGQQVRLQLQKDKQTDRQNELVSLYIYIIPYIVYSQKA